MLLSARAIREDAGRLDDDVDTELPPRQRRRVALREHPHLFAGRAQDPVAELDVAPEGAEVRVVLEEVSHRFRVSEVVERDDVDVGAERLLRAEEVPADASESVDAHPNAHSCAPLSRQVITRRV